MEVAAYSIHLENMFIEQIYVMLCEGGATRELEFYKKALYSGEFQTAFGPPPSHAKI